MKTSVRFSSRFLAGAGDAGDAFHHEIHRQRQLLDKQGNLAPQLAAAISRAETDAAACRAELNAIEEAAESHGWIVSDGWIIDYSGNPNDDDGALKPLEDRLDALKVKATDADHELATAMRAAVGDAQLGTEVPQAPPQKPSDETVPGPRPGDPPYDYHDKQHHDPPTMVPGAKVIPLMDNPPNFPAVGPGAQRDQNWESTSTGRTPMGLVE